MPTFRKRPIEIEAVQFVGCDDEEDWIESLKKVARDAIDQLQRIHALQPK